MPGLLAEVPGPDLGGAVADALGRVDARVSARQNIGIGQ